MVYEAAGCRLPSAGERDMYDRESGEAELLSAASFICGPPNTELNPKVGVPMNLDAQVLLSGSLEAEAFPPRLPACRRRCTQRSVA